MNINEDRGFHLEIYLLGELKLQYHDVDLNRFYKRSTQIINEYLESNGIGRDDTKSQLAQNIIIKWYTN